MKNLDSDTTRKFQDGGLRFNNPVNLALWETRVLWPKMAEKCDLVLSVGTGTASSNTELSSRPDSQGSWKTRYVPRLFRAFMNSLDGENTWQELYNGIRDSRKDRYYRINTKFDGEEPQLDDVDKMEELNRATSQGDLGTSTTETSIIEILVASQFYFELGKLPVPLASGRYACSGYIRCRSWGSQQEELLAHAHRLSADFRFGDELMEVAKCFQLCNGLLQQPCKFTVNDLNDEISITFGSFFKQRSPISGFPTSIAALQHAQGMDDAFGYSPRLFQDYEAPSPVPKRQFNHGSPLPEPKRRKQVTRG